MCMYILRPQKRGLWTVLLNGVLRPNDGSGNMVCENPQPYGCLVRRGYAVELRDNSQNFFLKNNRLPVEATNALTNRPALLSEFVIVRTVADHSLPRRSNATNCTNTERNSPQFQLCLMCPLLRPSKCRVGTGDKMEAARLIGAPRAHGARSAKITLFKQPSSRQPSMRTLCKPLHHPPQQMFHRSFRSNLQQEISQRIELRLIVDRKSVV